MDADGFDALIEQALAAEADSNYVLALRRYREAYTTYADSSEAQSALYYAAQTAKSHRRFNVDLFPRGALDSGRYDIAFVGTCPKSRHYR